MKTDRISNELNVFLNVCKKCNVPYLYKQGAKEFADILIECGRIEDKMGDVSACQCKDCEMCKRTATCFCTKFDMVVSEYDFCSFGSRKGI